MKSVEIYISPGLRELYQGLVLQFLNEDLRKRKFPSLEFYIMENMGEGINCDYVINNLRNVDARKLVKIINELDDYCVKIRDSKDSKMLRGPVKFM